MDRGKMLAKLPSCTVLPLLADIGSSQEATVYHGFTLLDPSRAAVETIVSDGRAHRARELIDAASRLGNQPEGC
jgi:hypothetical protein